MTYFSSRRVSFLIWCGWLVATAVGCGGEPAVDESEESPGGAPGSGGRSTIGIGRGGAFQVEPPGEQETPWTCGDGVLEPGELCDDGNTSSGDGCSGDCQEQDPNFDCSAAGEDCVDLVVCGNSRLEGDEACDDGNQQSDDGCAADCASVDDGFVCGKPGSPCVLVPVCGNGERERGEECDSGAISDPGCVDCLRQPGYYCLAPGSACLEDDCGNGVRTPNEQCDDGGNSAGDGCSPTCNAEPGWRCTAGGCSPVCGNGSADGAEACDDGNLTNGDGCSGGCQVEPGFSCPSEGSCTEAVCGDGTPEPGEGCDDGNQVAGDGCGPTCQLEPSFVDGVAQLACGDGLITGGEDCDDGNLTNGDGCNENCEVESGFVCDDLSSYPPEVELRVTYRDFKARAAAGGHPDFQWVSSPFRRDMPGPVCTRGNSAKCDAAPGVECSSGCGWLDSDGKPEHHLTGSRSERGTVTNADTYALWYRDTNDGGIEGQNGEIEVQSFSDTLVLSRIGGDQSDVYEFDSNGDTFYPLSGRGYGDSCDEVSPDCCDPGGKCLGRNYHFTTELRYFFQYQGGETLTFRGDDDVWVFVNGRLAVDIGGVHGALWGRVVLGDDGDGDATDSSCSVHGNGSEPADCQLEAEELADATDSRFGLTKGDVYEIVLFHAERHTTASNFKLTLAGFLAPRSSCRPDCGDGIVSGWEVCDSGDDNADGVYGVCNSTCTAIEFCGDASLQSPPETCDNGFNLSLYDDGGPNLCAPGCVAPPYCGDGQRDAIAEDCDLGAANNDGSYGGCDDDCTWGPYCGDGVTQAPQEACDEGADNVGYGDAPGACGYDCQPAPYCGDGERNGPERCDEGEDNDGSYGGCNPDCSRAPRCGDGKVQASEGEQCDDGPTGSLSCSASCALREVITR